MANDIRDAFDHIKADEHLIESTKQFITENNQKKPRMRFQKTFAAACAALLLAIGITGYSWTKTPVSYISIDVNPSIELSLNRFGRVVSATAFNAEGRKILETLSLKGKRDTTAVHEIIENETMQTFLSDEAELVLTVAEEKTQRGLNRRMKACSNHLSHECQHIRADIEIVEDAHSYGLSFGKYYAYLQLSQYDSGVTPEDCKHMDISTIHELTCEHEQNETTDGENAPSKETRCHHHDKKHNQSHKQ